MIGQTTRKKGAALQTYGRGLEDLVAGDTAISHIDGARGALTFRGIDVAELAEHRSFEEVSYLVLYGELPGPAERKRWSAELARWRHPPAAALAALQRVPASAHPLAIYRTMLTAAACVAPSVERPGQDLEWHRPARILGWSTSLAAAAIRHLRGLPPVDPRPRWATWRASSTRPWAPCPRPPRRAPSR